LAFAIERPLYWILKNVFKRNRPPDIIPCFQSIVKASDKFSFPSGHTAAAFLLATLCYVFFGAIALPLFIWAAMVGLSRIWLGVHFPTDILAGSCLGIVIGVNSFHLLFS
jgi:undecaprenyl-diphosphatase